MRRLGDGQAKLRAELAHEVRGEAATVTLFGMTFRELFCTGPVIGKTRRQLPSGSPSPVISLAG